jgi:hypothetical protein
VTGADARNLTLGDMTVVGEPPAKLLKALAVIADRLHPGFDLYSDCAPGKSKESCVLCSLTVRDFLHLVGFEDARVRPVAVVLWADENGVRLHSAGIGTPEDKREVPADRWIGHLVVTCRGFIIDTTLYQVQRPAWPELTGMIALPIAPLEPQRIYDLPLLAGIAADDEKRGYQFSIGWLDNPTNRVWLRGPDGRDRNRRVPVVQRLVDRFGQWGD